MGISKNSFQGASEHQPRQVCLAILGPTASGKTGFAVDLARELKGEILCVDSTTVYKGFDIGSSKASVQDRERVPHHLLDILEPSETFSAHLFVQKAEAAIQDILGRGRIPILVGGTYFYFRALQHGMNPVPEITSEYIEKVEKEFFEGEGLNTARMHEELKKADPKAAETIHPHDKYRLLRALALVRTTGKPVSELKPIPVSPSAKNRLWIKYAVVISRQRLVQNISRRTERMLFDGLVEETRRLRQAFPGARGLDSIGYAECSDFLDGKISEKVLRTEINDKTRQLAKRQMTWLRSDPEVKFIDFRDLDRVKLDIQNLMFSLGETVCNP